MTFILSPRDYSCGTNVTRICDRFPCFSRKSQIYANHFFRRIQSGVILSYRCKKFIFSKFIIFYDIPYIYGFDEDLYEDISHRMKKRNRTRHALNSLIPVHSCQSITIPVFCIVLLNEISIPGLRTNWNFSRWRFYGFVVPAAPFIHSHPSQPLSTFVSLFHVAIPMLKWELSRPLWT